MKGEKEKRKENDGRKKMIRVKERREERTRENLDQYYL